MASSKCRRTRIRKRTPRLSSDYDPAGQLKIIAFTSTETLLSRGGVTGCGAVFCTGKMLLSGGADLGSDSLCALVAGKDLTLKGTGADKTQFRGLVYSEGAIIVSDVTVVGAIVGNSASGAAMVVDRANLVCDPEGVNLTIDQQFSGFGRNNTVFGGGNGVLLPLGSTLTPESLYREGSFHEPSQEELKQGLLFRLSGQAPRRWDELSLTEQSTATPLLERAASFISPQVRSWNEQHLTPSGVNSSYHLDLNRFVKVHDSMKILTRRTYRT